MVIEHYCVSFLYFTKSKFEINLGTWKTSDILIFFFMLARALIWVVPIASTVVLLLLATVIRALVIALDENVTLGIFDICQIPELHISLWDLTFLLRPLKKVISVAISAVFCWETCFDLATTIFCKMSIFVAVVTSRSFKSILIIPRIRSLRL